MDITRKEYDSMKNRIANIGKKAKSSKKVVKSGKGTERLLKRAIKGAVVKTFVVKNLPAIAPQGYQGIVDDLTTGGIMKVFKQGGSANIEVGLQNGGAKILNGNILPALSGLFGRGQAQSQLPVGQSIQSSSLYK